MQPRRRIQNRALWEADVFYLMLRIRINMIHMFLGLPAPDPLVRGSDPDPSIIKQNGKKTLDFYCFVTYLWLFYLWKMMNVPGKKIFVGILMVTDENSRIWISQRYGSADPDPYQCITYPQHCFYPMFDTVLKRVSGINIVLVYWDEYCLCLINTWCSWTEKERWRVCCAIYPIIPMEY